ncbi:MAG: hypothetical protein KTR15_06305 [Phycisphaeraceae bacterium]|nr:hypothetical protein [Phycisphaeraceae bacterium]
MLEHAASLRMLTAAGLLALLAFTGCQAERPVVAPVEPDWSYHDGSEQLSNNDAWEKMIPTSALLRYDESKLAHVEESTAE